MSKSTISTFQLFEMFPTAESARIYLESRLWPDGAFCPECKSRERIGKQPKVGFYCGQGSRVPSETQDQSGQAPEAEGSICKAPKERVIYIIPNQKQSFPKIC